MRSTKLFQERIIIITRNISYQSILELKIAVSNKFCESAMCLRYKSNIQCQAQFQVPASQIPTQAPPPQSGALSQGFILLTASLVVSIIFANISLSFHVSSFVIMYHQFVNCKSV